MKTLLLFLLACTASFAQEFKATPTGLVSKKLATDNYVVASFDSIPADTLYANAKRYILSKYTSGIKNPITTDEKANLLRFDSGEQTMSTLTKKGKEIKYVGSTTGTLEFKEGKVKISYGNVVVSSITSDVKKDLPLTSYWNSKGKVVDNETKNIVETHFNASTKLLIDAMGNMNNKASAEW